MSGQRIPPTRFDQMVTNSPEPTQQFVPFGMDIRQSLNYNGNDLAGSISTLSALLATSSVGSLLYGLEIKLDKMDAAALYTDKTASAALSSDILQLSQSFSSLANAVSNITRSTDSSVTQLQFNKVDQSVSSLWSQTAVISNTISALAFNTAGSISSLNLRLVDAETAVVDLYSQSRAAATSISGLSTAQTRSNNSIAALWSANSSIQSSLSGLVSSSTAVTLLSSQFAGISQSFSSLSNSINNILTSTTSGITQSQFNAADQSIGALWSANSGVRGSLSSLSAVIATLAPNSSVSALQSRVSNVEITSGSLWNAVTSLSALQTRITLVEQTAGSLWSASNANRTSLSGLTTRITFAEQSISGLFAAGLPNSTNAQFAFATIGNLVVTGSSSIAGLLGSVPPSLAATVSQLSTTVSGMSQTLNSMQNLLFVGTGTGLALSASVPNTYAFNLSGVSAGNLNAQVATIGGLSVGVATTGNLYSTGRVQAARGLGPSYFATIPTLAASASYTLPNTIFPVGQGIYSVWVGSTNAPSCGAIVFLYWDLPRSITPMAGMYDVSLAISGNNLVLTNGSPWPSDFTVFTTPLGGQ